MLAITILLNVIWVFVIVIFAAFAGYIFRSNQINKRKKQIVLLENEMLKSHEEILKLQKELAILEKEGSPPYKTRVVPMNDSNSEKDAENNEATPKKEQISSGSRQRPD